MLDNLDMLMAKMESSTELEVLKDKENEIQNTWKSINTKLKYDIARLEDVHCKAEDLELKVKSLKSFLVLKEKQIICLEQAPCIEDQLLVQLTKIDVYFYLFFL